MGGVRARVKMKIKEFLKSIKGLSENTRRSYEQTLWQIDSFIQGEEPTKSEIGHFLSKYQTASLHRHKAAIKTYLEWYDPDKAWPFGRHEFPVKKREIPRYFPPERVDELTAAAAENKDDAMFIKTLFQLGARISEAMAITGESITPAGVTVVGKGGYAKLIPTTKEFKPELVKYAGKKRGRIFPKPYTYYYKLLKRVGLAIGVKDISPHMLRHARAVDLLRKKMSPAFVQQFLRHSNFNTTAIYLEITGGELGDELQKIEDNGKAVHL